MTISDFIGLLEDRKNICGDIEVGIYNPLDADIYGIDFEEQLRMLNIEGTPMLVIHPTGEWSRQFGYK